MRQSLEVPGDAAPVVAAEPTNGAPLQPITNGSVETPPQASATYMPGVGDGLDDIGVEKRNSLGRSGPAAGGRYARRPVGLNRMSMDHANKRDSIASSGGNDSSTDSPVGGRVGVSLTDKPMDD